MKTNSKYFYEEAKKDAIYEMHRHLKEYLRCTQKFEHTNDTWYQFKAMYHNDFAERLARSWGLWITEFSMSSITVKGIEES